MVDVQVIQCWYGKNLIRLGDHIAAVLSALVNASDVRSNSGLDTCTSKQCAWLPVARNVSQINVIFLMIQVFFSNKVSPASVKDIQFYCPGNKKHRLSKLTSSLNTQTLICLQN